MKGIQANKLDKWSELLVAALILLLPFHAFLKTWLTYLLTDSTIDSLSTGSFLISMWKELIIIVLGIFWVINLAIRKKMAFSWLEADIFLALFLLINIVYVLATKDASAAVWGLKSNCAFIVLYFLARSIRFRTLTQKNILDLLLGTTLIVNAVALLQYVVPPSFWLMFGYSPYVSSYVDSKPLPIYHGIGENFDIIRLNSTLSGPNQLGAYLSIIALIFIATLYIKKYYTSAQKYSVWLLILSSVTVLVFTFSRAALIGFMVGFLILSLIKVPIKHKALLSSIAGIMLILFLGIWSFVQPQSFDTYIVHGASTEERLVKWQEGTNIVLSNPLGLGLGQAGPVSRRLYGEDKGIISENWYLQIAEETGIISLLLILVGFFYLLKHLYDFSKKTIDPVAEQVSLGLCVALCAILVNGLFLHTWDDATTSYIMALLLGFYINQYDSFLHTTSKLRSKALQALLHYVKK